ncbi:hypothetical protein ES703_101903 [subsurface metagenome]
MPIAADDRLPVAITNAGTVSCATRAILGVVVLGTAHQMVERFIIINIYFVELGQGKIGEIFKCFAAIERPIKPPVTADQQKVGIIRMKNHDVIVHVFPAAFDGLPSLAAILGAS